MNTTAIAIIGSGPAGLMPEVALHDLQRGCICEAAARKVYFLEGPDA